MWSNSGSEDPATPSPPEVVWGPGDLRGSFCAVIASISTDRPGAPEDWSGWPGSNRRPSAPKADALPLRYTPISGRRAIETDPRGIHARLIQYIRRTPSAKFFWWARWESNPSSCAYKALALPVELLARPNSVTLGRSQLSKQGSVDFCPRGLEISALTRGCVDLLIQAASTGIIYGGGADSFVKPGLCGTMFLGRVDS